MQYIVFFDAKADVSAQEINVEREKWCDQGKDEELSKRCKMIRRYEVVGKSPLQIVFIIETDDPTALNILSRHFGKKWHCVSYPVVERDIAAALKEDEQM
ncbi:MAG: hypothetical protein KKE17_00250 [Proteobacteria bacterium]|nr:hypothetical protein [Pseudomonadota bacterium]MBU1708414.1 hypothetical protein [Pseudomonadota bacterium]